MNILSASTVIHALETDVDDRKEPCFVSQQEDTNKTTPCQGTGEILNGLLRLIGINIPIPEEPEEYSTSIQIKPKNTYIDLNLSLTHGVLSEPVIKAELVEQKTTVSIGDFTKGDGIYYLNVTDMLDLVESDNITSAEWRGTPVDDNLGNISPPPQLSITEDGLIRSSTPANGIMLVRYHSTTINHDVVIEPREGAVDNFYESYIIIKAEGCSDDPFFYRIEVPDCYERRQLTKRFANLVPGAGGTEVEHEGPEDRPPTPPKGGENYSCEYCLCNPGKLKSGDENVCQSAETEDNTCSPKDC